MISALLAVGDQHCIWLTNDSATVKLRPVNHRHGRIAKYAIGPVALLLFVAGTATLVAFQVPEQLFAALMFVVVFPVVGGTYSIYESGKRTRGFATDLFCAELCRHHQARAGAGAALDHIGVLAEAEQLVIGGVAENIRLRNNFYLAAGAGCDCGHQPHECDNDAERRRTVFAPRSSPAAVAASCDHQPTAFQSTRPHQGHLSREAQATRTSDVGGPLVANPCPISSASLIMVVEVAVVPKLLRDPAGKALQVPATGFG